ncbi:MAG: hypothetical protein Q7J65_04260 [Candidatus Marinimicrobia bacterium]|nr:hypothetical protein [Candidatus Neomarinimicrobiota bacterium]
MKKILLFSLIIMFLFAGICYAGILGTAKDWVLDNAIGTILASLFLIVGGFFGGSAVGKIILKSKVPIYELKDVAMRIHEARRPSSPGGAKVTALEKDAILKEVEELIAAVVKVFGTA